MPSRGVRLKAGTSAFSSVAGSQLVALGFVVALAFQRLGHVAAAHEDQQHDRIGHAQTAAE